MAVTETDGFLSASVNIFNGVDVDPEGLPEDPERFAELLQRSLDLWKSQGLKVVWLELPLRRAALIPVAAEVGFGFHHSDPWALIMTLRLQSGAFVPPHATHYIGAGGLVLNDRDELLVVTEVVHRHRHPHYYKLPGGALKPGEHLVDGVMREVWEETGIRTRFEAVMGFRHWHGYRFGKSDIYFICQLTPLTAEIHIQESEIEEALWMPLDDYLSDEHVGIFNKEMVAAAARAEGLAPGRFDGYAMPETHEIFVPAGSHSAILIEEKANR